jgi:hypothetical protein
MTYSPSQRLLASRAAAIHHHAYDHAGVQPQVLQLLRVANMMKCAASCAERELGAMHANGSPVLLFTDASCQAVTSVSFTASIGYSCS